MKRFLFSLLTILLLSPGIAPGQTAFSDSLNTAERDYFYRKYRSIRDTMRINTWLNLKRVSDNLEQVVKRDQSVIDALNRKIESDAVEMAALRDSVLRFQELRNSSHGLDNQLYSDPEAMLKLKVALAASFILLLVFFALYYGKSRRLRQGRHELEQAAAANEAYQLQLGALDAEIRKLRHRETEFREELEKGMETFQSRLLSLQQKCEILERENTRLADKSETGERAQPAASGHPGAGSELPDDADELREMVKSLLDERNSLINLAERLRKQAEKETLKYQEIVGRIKTMADDLSGVPGNPDNA